MRRALCAPAGGRLAAGEARTHGMSRTMTPLRIGIVGARFAAVLPAVNYPPLVGGPLADLGRGFAAPEGLASRRRGPPPQARRGPPAPRAPDPGADGRGRRRPAHPASRRDGPEALPVDEGGGRRGLVGCGDHL